MKLAKTDEYGFFEIRLESIGGLGAHLAGEILARACVFKMGYNAAHFSSYGSEKKGTPVKSFVRLADINTQIRTSSPIEQPHIIVVFHEALLKLKVVLSGLREDGILILNTKRLSEEFKSIALPQGVKVYTVDAFNIAIEEKSRVNTALLGSLAKACEFLDKNAVLDTIVETFADKYPQSIESNKKTFNRGYQELKQVEYKFKVGNLPTMRPSPIYGYKTAPSGGIITNPGNSVLNNLTTSRTGFIPVYNKEKCIHCSLCDLVCPDYAFVWDTEMDENGNLKVRLKGIDYHYCKGCLKCIDSCPTFALSKEIEEPCFAEEHRVEAFNV